MAGETGLEPAADGFGDRYSTNCATPLNRTQVIVYNTACFNVNASVLIVCLTIVVIYIIIKPYFYRIDVKYGGSTCQAKI